VSQWRTAKMRELVRISKALSDEKRVRMLKLLLVRDICVCEMEEILPMSASQISRSLKMIMDAGFLKRWREGKCVVYAVDRSSANRYCRALLELLTDSFNSDETVLKDRDRLEQVVADKVRERKK